MNPPKAAPVSRDSSMDKEIDLTAKKTAPTPSSSNYDIDSESQATANLKAVQGKVDKRLLAWYCFVYLIMRIHVTNVTNTAIINEESGDDILTQLGNLSSGQWAWVLSIFYYPYAAFEPASTLLLKRFKPNIWMSRIMLT